MIDLLDELRLEAGDHGVAHEEGVRDLFARAADEIARLRLVKLPNWAQAALTSSTARITIEQHKDWLATVPEPIEPANG